MRKIHLITDRLVINFERWELLLTSPETRWSRRKQARPAEILDAALKVFAQKGFAAARMDDIAKAAGVTKGTIYLYFENKEEVFKSLVRETVGTTLGAVAADVQTYQGSARFLLRMVITTHGPDAGR